MPITIHTDGACRGNPGAASIAYVITGLEEQPIEYAKPIGTTTNNQAEYQAMRAAVERLAEANPSGESIEIFSDSELMIRQLTGVYRVKDPLIRPWYEEITGMLSSMKPQGNTFELTAIRREHNKRADELANMALDGQL
jgi:ribonuclease HI